MTGSVAGSAFGLRSGGGIPCDGSAVLGRFVQVREEKTPSPEGQQFDPSRLHRRAQVNNGGNSAENEKQKVLSGRVTERAGNSLHMR